MIRSKIVDKGIAKFTSIQAIGVLLLYVLGQPFVSLLSNWITVNILRYDAGIHEFVILPLTVVLFILILLTVWKPLNKSFRHFFSYGKAPLSLWNVAKTWAMMMAGSMLIVMFINLFVPPGNQAGNQSAVESLFGQAPVYMFFNIVVFAPIVEEIIFRGVLYQNLRSERYFWIPMFVSAFIFGGLHVFPTFLETGNFLELIYLLQYCGMAFFIIRAMESTDSIIGAMLLHAINNSLSLFAIIMTSGVIR